MGFGLAAAAAILWTAVPGSRRSAGKDAKPKQIPHEIKQKSSVPGRADIPNAEVAKQLRGVAPPPIATPVDKLPIPQLKLPKGFKVEVYASGIANARTLRMAERARCSSATACSTRSMPSSTGTASARSK